MAIAPISCATPILFAVSVLRSQIRFVDAFAIRIPCSRHEKVSSNARRSFPFERRRQPLSSVAHDDDGLDDPTSIESTTINEQIIRSYMRRSLLAGIAASLVSPILPSDAAIDVSAVQMKTFVDPQGLFTIRVPKGFYTLRRSAKGDLPDNKTGKGRRGSSIFTAGDMNKAEVVSVERFPVSVLLEEQGIAATGDLSNFSAIGTPFAVAKLLLARREKDAQRVTNTRLVKESVRLSEDNKTLEFQLLTVVDVQKPELLMEQTGLSELIRLTIARVELHSGDGQIMAVYASALEQDFNGNDGDLLRDVLASFDVNPGT